MKKTAAMTLLSLFAVCAPAVAQTGHQHAHATTVTAQATVADLYPGEVRRVNKDTRQITLAHGPLKAFNMPAMTMAFPVKDPALLGKVKPGDKIQFALEKSGENLVITRIELAK